MRKENDLFLNVIARQTNMRIPYSDYISADKYPAQNTNLLNTDITLKYRKYGDYNLDLMKKSSSRRPEDDFGFIEPSEHGPEETENPYFLTCKAKVLRADNEYPYILIAVSEDYSMILVNSSEPVNDSYKFDTEVSVYTIQRNEFIGIEIESQYFASVNNINAVSLRVDSGEPCLSVFIEYIDNDNVRFTLGDEHYSIIKDKNDIKVKPKYNILKDYEVVELRKRLLEGV